MYRGDGIRQKEPGFRRKFTPSRGSGGSWLRESVAFPQTGGRSLKVQHDSTMPFNPTHGASSDVTHRHTTDVAFSRSRQSTRVNVIV